MKKVFIGIAIALVILITVFILFNNIDIGKKDDEDTLDTNRATIQSSDNSITIEGTPENVQFSDYSSRFGYTIKYDSGNFEVSEDENSDLFSSNEFADIYFSIEFFKTSYEDEIASISSDKKDITINGHKGVYTEQVEDEQLKCLYYIKANSGVYIITSSHPNSSEYVEGWGSRMKSMIETFNIN